ncbi:MAG: hypothetical protein EOP49_20770, partial [Sphingobacteriales bacterium]
SIFRGAIPLIAAACGLMATPASAQQITGSEYFFNTDPGIGNGTPLAIGGAADSVNFSASITVPPLSPGYHMLYARTRDNNGQWSLQHARRFFVKPQLVAAEYYFDTDPGTGNGFSIPVPSAYDTTSFGYTVNTPAGMSVGAHTLYVRVKDNQGIWSLHGRQRFFIKDQVIAAEYFFDTDPGVGNGTSLPVTAAYDTTSFSQQIPVGSLSPGVHMLYVRTKNGSGSWGLAAGRKITVTNAVAAAEYFFDLDPGPGNGYALSVPGAADSLNFTTGITIPPLTEGWHNLYIRTRDVNGRWSLYQRDSIDVLPFSCLPPAITTAGSPASCFGNEDGNATVSLAGGTGPFGFLWTGPGSFVSNQQNITGLKAGIYYLTVTATGGCTVSDTVIISSPDSIILNLATNSPVCQGDSLLLDVSSNFDTSATTAYLWQGPSGYSASVQHAVINVAPLSYSGIFKVYISTGANCTDSASVPIVVQQNIIYYADFDGDGYGNTNESLISCTGAPAGYVITDGDCADSNAAIHPNHAEICNGIDDDCDNAIDEGLSFVTYYADADNDGFGDPGVSQSLCSGNPGGHVTNNTDCNDNDSLSHPGQIWYTDADGDGYGSGSSSVQCQRPLNGYLDFELNTTSGDCNDNNAAIHPLSSSISFTSGSFGSSLVSPQLGSQYTLFQFEASYTDSNNQLPPAFYPRVLLDYEGNGNFNDLNDRTIIMSEADVENVSTQL